MIILTYGEKNILEYKKKRMFGLNSNHAEKYTRTSEDIWTDFILIIS